MTFGICGLVRVWAPRERGGGLHEAPEVRALSGAGSGLRGFYPNARWISKETKPRGCGKGLRHVVCGWWPRPQPPSHLSC